MFAKVKEIIVFFIVAGFMLALLKAFNWDVGAIFTWITTSIYNVIESIANFFTGNTLFQKAVKA